MIKWAARKLEPVNQNRLLMGYIETGSEKNFAGVEFLISSTVARTEARQEFILFTRS